MSRLHILFLARGGTVQLTDGEHSVAPGSIAMVASCALKDMPSDGQAYPITASTFQSVYRNMLPMLNQSTGGGRPEYLHVLSAAPDLIQSLVLLAKVDTDAMLRFVLTYFLVMDAERCAALLHFVGAEDFDLFDFIHRHRLEAWPVTRYADALGLSLRKFNELFYTKFGMSAKHWLLSQRLMYARQQLETTSKKIIDVALESGFCNAAHFSDSFRRHFEMSPSDIRREHPFAGYAEVALL